MGFGKTPHAADRGALCHRQSARARGATAHPRRAACARQWRRSSAPALPLASKLNSNRSCFRSSVDRIDDVARVQHASGFKTQNFGLFVGASPVLNALRYHHTFPWSQANNLIMKFHAKISTPNEEKLVFSR